MSTYRTKGHVDSALPVSRTLHEALVILEVVNDDAEQTILDRWLEDREVEPKKVRAAAERQAQRVAEEVSAQGVDLEMMGSGSRWSGCIPVLSDVQPHPPVGPARVGGRVGVGHGCDARSMAVTPDPVQRAAGAASTVLSVEATIIGVGDALASFYGGPYCTRQIIEPIQDGLMKSTTQTSLALTAS